MVKPIISIIIPVHNTANYLRRCINSLLVQTQQDFEIILIDNKSTDNSLEIIKEFKKKYPNKIQALTCPRSGASAARNDGIMKANGIFVAFVDSDDYVEPTYIEKIIAQIRNNADIIFINAHGTDSHLGLVNWSKDIKKNFILSGPGPYCVVIRRDIFINNSLSFHEGIIYEDTAIMASLVLYATTIRTTTGNLYIIERRDDSTMRKKKWNEKIGTSIYTALDDLYYAFDRKGGLDEYHDELESVFAVAILYTVSKYLLRFKEGNEYYLKNRKYLKSKFPRWYNNKYIKSHYSKKIRLFMFLNYLGFAPVLRIFVNMKRRLRDDT